MVLEKIQKATFTPEEIRVWRAVEVLERMATPDARRLLEKLSKGDPGACLTGDAEQAAARVAKRLARAAR